MGTPDFPDRPWRWDPLGAGHFTPGRMSAVRLIVLHCTDNDASNEDEDAYAHRRTDASAHFYVDDDDVIQTVRLADQAWSAHSIANGISVHIEMTARGSWSRAQWLAHDGLLRQAGAVVQAVGLKLGIPVRYLNEKQVGARLYGATGHRECVLAFGQGDHLTCPGPEFPWDVLLRYATGGDDDMSAEDTANIRKVVHATVGGDKGEPAPIPAALARIEAKVGQAPAPVVIDYKALAREIIGQLISKD